MRPVVAVDLAARFSACVHRLPSGEVRRQWDSFKMSPADVASAVRETYFGALYPFTGTGFPIVVVEDLPPHVPSSTVAKHVAQLQGRIIQEFSIYGTRDVHDVMDDLFFVPPAYWERDMGVFRKPLEEWEALAAELGYIPPDLVAERGYERGARGMSVLVKDADKQRTDYVAAFLLSEWTRRCIDEGRDWDSKIIKQYKD